MNSHGDNNLCSDWDSRQKAAYDRPGTASGHCSLRMLWKWQSLWPSAQVGGAYWQGTSLGSFPPLLSGLHSGCPVTVTTRANWLRMYFWSLCWRLYFAQWAEPHMLFHMSFYNVTYTCLHWAVASMFPFFEPGGPVSMAEKMLCDFWGCRKRWRSFSLVLLGHPATVLWGRRGHWKGCV